MSYITPAAQKIIDQQGWDDSTIISLMGDFLEATNQAKAFEKYLKGRADAENAEAEGS
jgi:hypothetical protein